MLSCWIHPKKFIILDSISFENLKRRRSSQQPVVYQQYLLIHSSIIRRYWKIDFLQSWVAPGTKRWRYDKLFTIRHYHIRGILYQIYVTKSTTNILLGNFHFSSLLIYKIQISLISRPIEEFKRPVDGKYIVLPRVT